VAISTTWSAALAGTEWDAVFDVSGVAKVAGGADPGDLADLLAGHLGRYVYVSSQSLYRMTGAFPWREDSPVVAPDVTTYAGFKVAAERALLARHVTGGFPATLGAYALSAKAHGYSKFAMLVSNVPAAIQGAELLGSLVFKNAGVGYKVIPVNPGTADVTPQLQAAVSWGAKAIGLTGDVTLCSSFLKGYQTLGLTEPKYVISTCLDPSIFSTLGSELGGSYIDTTSNATSAEDSLYAAITQKFAPSVNGNPNASAGQASGLIPVFSLLDIMSGYTGAVTPAAVKAQLALSTTRTVPLSGGITYLCNGKAIPLLPSVCSAASAVGTLSSAGAVSGLQNYNPSPLFKE